MTILRNIVAVLLGLVAGSLINGGLIQLGTKLIPPPAGADTATMEGLRAALPLFEPIHFLFPFLAHALGTLAGAFVATFASKGRRPLYGWIVGGLFLVAGVINVVLLPAPVWFSAVDLLFAYLPMAWLGARLVPRPRPRAPGTTGVA